MEYIERFIEKDFKEWKDSANDYVLEVAGCRQVGKTTAVRHFAEQNYKNVIYVDVVSKDNTKILERVDEYNVEESLRSYCKLKMLEQHQIDFAVYAKGGCKCGVDEQKYTLPVFLFNKFTFDKGGVVERAPLPKLTKDSFRPKSNR